MDGSWQAHWGCDTEVSSGLFLSKISWELRGKASYEFLEIWPTTILTENLWAIFWEFQTGSTFAIKHSEWTQNKDHFCQRDHGSIYHPFSSRLISKICSQNPITIPVVKWNDLDIRVDARKRGKNFWDPEFGKKILALWAKFENFCKIFKFDFLRNIWIWSKVQGSFSKFRVSKISTGCTLSFQISS